MRKWLNITCHQYIDGKALAAESSSYPGKILGFGRVVPPEVQKFVQTTRDGFEAKALKV